MKRGFLNNAKTTKTVKKAVLTADIERDSGPGTVNVIDLAAQSKEVGGLKRAPVALDGLDELLQQKRIIHKEMDSSLLDHPDDLWIITTQPATADELDGRSECYVSGRAKRAIVNFPGFPSSLPRPTNGANCWRVENSPGKGMGVFANCDMKQGDLIMAERPLLVIPAMMEPMIPMTMHTTPEQMRQLVLLQQEKTMEMLVGRLTEEDQKAYRELYNCHTEDGSGPLFGVHRTNALEVSDYFEPVVYSSCRPNAAREWDSPTFSLHLRATRNIKKDEEITITYLSDLLIPTAERQYQLRSYGFQCGCEACSNPTSSDANRKKIQKFGEPFFQPMAIPRSGPPPLMDLLINPTLRDIKLMEDEGLESIKAYGDYAGRLMNGYMQLGNKTEEKKWRRASVAHKLVWWGARNTAIKEAAEAEKKQKEMMEKMLEETWAKMSRMGVN
ncbi:hypothetical protein D9758_005412 [Tetrapyrgos nigripes]|uniref:SET domain-containing protein n=1 Tax=Tetrapyrgos nigripes TaxID=182062 RepID=A0A8H5GHS2_9AGAR|nr:hypothetical protein D9758_005412 [Tetrapyrgos nigripes]